MDVAGPEPASREDLSRQVERIVASKTFHSSDSLRRLLQYLVDRAVQPTSGTVKEFQIAVDVFGRSADFDSRLDAIVRVQMGRLRTKLAEYYVREGMQDEVVIDLPKGSYTLSAHTREISAPPAPVPSVPEASPAIAAVAPAPLFDWRNIAITLLIVALLITLGVLAAIELSRSARVAAAPGKPHSQVLATFWANFIDNGQKPLIVFSNAEFVGRPETSMRYFNSATDGSQQILDHYTGIGEVFGVQELTLMFEKLGIEPRVKRGRLLSLDDAKHNDVVFLGSPTENLSLRDLPAMQDFVFEHTESVKRPNDLAVVNRHPQSGEERQYMASANLPIQEDYAVVSLLPGLSASRWTLVLAGTTTLGTQAAVEFVCRERDVAELLRRTTPPGQQESAPFESVLRVKVKGGEPVSSEIVALHVRR